MTTPQRLGDEFKEMEAKTAAASEGVKAPASTAKDSSISNNSSQQFTSARSWFEALSPEECAVAMSFRDGPFLASFLTLAAAKAAESVNPNPWQPLFFKTASEGSLDLTMAADLKEVEASLGSYEKQFADGSTELKKTAEPPVDPDVSEEPAGTTQPMAVLKEAKATADAVAINTTNATSSTEEKKKVSPKTTVTTDQEIILFPDDDRIRNGKSKEQSSNDNEATFNSTPTAKTKNTAETELTIDPQKKRTSDENEVVTHPDIDIKKTEHTDADDAKSTEAVSHNPVTETPAKKDSMDDQKETTDEDVAAVVVANDDSTMEKLTVKLPPAAEEVAKSICSVFPAAAATTTTDSVSTVAATGASNIPFVTLQPVFLNIKGSGDIAKALDSILQSFSPSTSFLDFDCLPSNEADSTSEEKIYLQRLKSLLDAANNKKDTHRKSSSVLLFLVLLIRIEVAVYMAFRDNNAKKATEAKIDAERKMHQSTLSYLLTQVDVMDNLSNTINPTTLKEVMAPLIEAGFCSFSADDVSFSATELKLSNLLFTPLSVLVQTISNLGESSDRPSFDSWDKAWKATVGNIRDFVDTAKKEGAAASNPVKDEGAKNNGNQDKSTMPENEANRSSETSAGEAVVQSNSSDWMDDNSPSVVTPIPASKKNKKKKSKRKKKKNISNNNNGELGGQANDKGGTAKKEEAVPAEIAEVDAKGRDEVKNDETSPSETDKAERHESSDPSATLEDKSPSDSAPDQTATAEPAVSATPTGSAEAAAASRPREGGTNITQTASFDSDKNVMSMSDDTASTRSESSKPEENDSNGETKANNDFSVSRVHGVGTVVVAPSATEGPSQSGGPNGNDKGEARNRGDSSAGDDANNDDWETVEVKGRSNRKKGGRASGQSNNGHSQNGGNKSKSTRTSASRKRVANRKMAKDILSSVLDSVDEEVKRKQQLKARSAKTSTPQKPAWQVPRTIGQVNGANKEPPSGTLRDVVVGNQAGNQQRKGTQGSQKNSTTKQPGNASSKTVEKGDSSSLGKRVKGQTAVGADQNTASTVPETVSAVSDARRMQASSDRDITRSDWSSGGDSDEARKQDHPSKKANSAKDASPAPPLPTLLSPGNANSSSSSVASSLEAPHANHGHHHTPANENDVGYHLLDVCNRLTRDMDVFMGRRAAALGTRRKERGALLAALQECVSSLWNGHPHVELYGSCATMLDLPSSDLDVVVLGLDHMEAAMAPSSPQNSLPNCTGSPGDSSTSDKSGADIPLPHHHSMPHYMPMPMNAERVVRLAAELDRHPWAVHVKAIPTATVPVVKVLADPSRLPGMVPPVIGEEYVPQHVQAPASRLQPSDPTLSPVGMPQQNVYQPEMAQPVWRGADVMNGLLSLDITFEGPEHGGIGSTEFSARAVQEVCNETGLVAEGTPFVQVIMVVKELLAQRRLNEPFSGGLSSYSLLLLVLAVVRERKVIREELERVERQRRVVAAGVGGSCVGGSFEQEKLPQTNLQQSGNKSDPASTKAADRPGNGEAPSKDKKKGSVSQHQADGKSSSKAIEKRAQSGNAQQGNSSQKQWASKAGQKVSKADPAPNHARDPQSTQPPSKKPSGGSWAYVAKGSKCDSSGTPSQMSKAGDKQKEQHQQNKAGPQKPGSFADAVARSQAKAASNAQATSQGKAANASASDNGQTSGYTKKINKKQTNQQAAKTGQAAKNEYAKNVIENASKNGDKESSGGALQQPALDGPEKLEGQTPRKIDADEETSKFNNYSSGISADPSLSGNQSLFPQGFNDVIEVLCSGDTTPGKLLMHFLLFYGQHFDAHATAIDISGKHHRDIPMQNPPYTHLSPYMQRRSAGTIDPVTGMLTVDPIVVYDPLEGAEQNNVARRCFLWSSVKWVFAQSYMTLSSAVEQNTTPSTTPGARSGATAPNNGTATHQHQETPVSENAAWNGPYNPTDKGNLFDPSSPHPLLELLLSF